jgi:hypothetical protein
MEGDMTRPFEMARGLADEATKNVKKAPGWLMLWLTCYVLAQFVPHDFVVLGFPVHEHTEVASVLATGVLFLLGDAMDEALFDDLTETRPQRLVDKRKAVKKKLKLKEHLYQVSLKIAVAAKRYDGTLISLENETSKFVRSLVVPSALSIPVVFAILLWLGHPWGSVIAPLLLIALTLALFRLYIWLKIDQMCKVYDVVIGAASTSLKFFDSPNSDSRHFYWEGTEVATGPLDS